MSFILKISLVYCLLASYPINSAFLKSFRKEALIRLFMAPREVMKLSGAVMLPGIAKLLSTVRSMAIIKTNFLLPSRMAWLGGELVLRNIYFGFFVGLLFAFYPAAPGSYHCNAIIVRV